ncbi:D-alanyl-D-alanine carboxypeptidase [Bartonella sp. CB178]|uniref:D-alanyl-D-alanine carboxypeptidase n=1 Tax=Bartonella sp. CB178 TaxID=3112255 RepID=UPI00300DD8F2
MCVDGKKIVYFCKKLVISYIVLALSCSWASATPKGAYPDKYAAIVIDANTGKTLFEANATLKRYPASLTKMMTLYMLFEAMHTGRITPKTPIPVSSYAAARPPTKIGLKAGQTISAEAAVKALITKSANDVATAVAEYLSGNEKKFAKKMTEKARKLGMMHTHFANASGLPDARNYSTARDMAILSLALRKDFPKRYRLFKTTSFTFHGRTISSHNKLVKMMKGVDGIKTGYTQMSGSNLATSMRMNGRSIVAVVMGGKSSAARDNHMSNLLSKYMPKASLSKGGNYLMASARYDLPTGLNAPVPIVKADPTDLDDEVSTLLTALAEQPKISDTAIAAINQAIIPIPNPQIAAINQAIIPIPNPQKAAIIKVKENHIVTASLSASTKWAIQVGSLSEKKQAKALLLKAENAASSALKRTSSHTQLFKKSGHHYYRARFIGFPSKKAASNACSTLKKANFNCYTVAY